MRVYATLRSILIAFGLAALSAAAFAQGWPQWGQNPQHSGAIPVAGQSPSGVLAHMVYDPFVAQEQAENGGELLAHYQVPLTNGQDVFMEFISGNYVSCNPPGSYTPFPCGNDNWFNQVWNEKRLHWQNGQLAETWSFASDWKPEPDAGGELGGWQPVFHAALTSDAVWVPGAGGSVFKLSMDSGNLLGRFNPFGSTIDPNTFVSSPITVDAQGNIYYNVLKLNITNDPTTNDPWSYGPNFDGNNVTDIPDAWLVKISSAGVINKVSYKSLTFSPPAPATCITSFSSSTLPWPPSPTAVPRTVPCLSQRPGLNISPAIAPDGTIYSVTVAQNPFASRYAYVVAFQPDLSLKWTASLRDRLNDGCGVLVPIAISSSPQANSCRFGANFGVDPSTNQKPAGRVIDQSSSSPVVTPDGGVIYAAYTRYDYARGHTFRFDANGNFAAAYNFGWDSTPAVYQHNGTYSVVIKDNHYDAGNYCDSTGGGVSLIVCINAPKGPYFVTQLDPNMNIEWQFKNTSTDATHNNGFQWSFSAPAVDLLGNVYANSEDGNLYVIRQGGTLLGDIFVNQGFGADTPLSLGPDGKLYTESDGTLFAIAQSPRVVSYQVLFGSQSFTVPGGRTNFPWTTITGVRVTFSEPVTGNSSSLTGVSVTSFSGSGTNTLTWTFSALTRATYNTKVLGTTANAVMDLAGNPLGGGVDFAQTLNVLPGDVSDDGNVASNDMVLVNNARSMPYNVIDDINGDGVVDINDVNLVRARIGTHLP